MVCENILFDLDGTLTDSAPGILASVRHALAAFDIYEQDEGRLREFLGPPLEYSFGKFYGFDAAQTERAIAVYRERFTDVGIFENTLYPDVLDMLCRLHEQKKRLCLATSKPLVYAQRILEYFEIERYFDIIQGAHMDVRGHTKADIIAAVLAQGKLAKEHTVMVGDRHFDINGAVQNGICPIGVTYGYGTEQELRQAGAQHTVHSAGELCGLLLG